MYFEKLVNSQASSSNDMTSGQTQMARLMININAGDRYYRERNAVSNIGTGASTNNGSNTSENVIIKNGVIGLSSHHGIYGHFNKNVLIENAHGVQFNGFDGVTINNCEIGPTSDCSYFRDEYGHARTFVKRCRETAMMHPGEELHFYGRDDTVTIPEIVDELQKQVDMAYNYVVNGIENNDDKS